MINFPSDAEIIAFAREHDVGGTATVLRDLARIATIAHFDDQGFFDSEHVLAGGMALRCYGGQRFTIRDADTSSKVKVKYPELEKLTKFDIPGRLVVEPDGRESGQDLETVNPVRFDPVFSDINLPPAAKTFSITANFRGLEEEPRGVKFKHHYPFDLGVENRRLPLMHPLEMLAEKVVGYSISVLDKHYADVAWLSFAFRKRFRAKDKAKLRGLTETKLERGREYSQRPEASDFLREAYQWFPNYDSLRAPLENPADFLGRSEFDGAQVKWVVGGAGPPIDLAKARQIVREMLIPILYP